MKFGDRFKRVLPDGSVKHYVCEPLTAEQDRQYHLGQRDAPRDPVALKCEETGDLAMVAIRNLPQFGFQKDAA